MLFIPLLGINESPLVFIAVYCFPQDLRRLFFYLIICNKLSIRKECPSALCAPLRSLGSLSSYCLISIDGILYQIDIIHLPSRIILGAIA